MKSTGLVRIGLPKMVDVAFYQSMSLFVDGDEHTFGTSFLERVPFSYLQLSISQNRPVQ